LRQSGSFRPSNGAVVKVKMWTTCPLHGTWWMSASRARLSRCAGSGVDCVTLGHGGRWCAGLHLAQTVRA
jgi:hypothetical protein